MKKLIITTSIISLFICNLCDLTAGQITAKAGNQTGTSGGGAMPVQSRIPQTLVGKWLGEDEKSFQETVRKVMVALQTNDEKTLNSLILERWGIAIVSRPGAMDEFSVYDTISMNENPSGYTVTLGEMLRGNLAADQDIRFENLPVMDCGEEKWDKTNGVYCDINQSIDRLSAIAALTNEIYESEQFSSNETRKFKEIEASSRQVTAIGTGEHPHVLAFYLTCWNGKWYLTIIDLTVGFCGA
jgi:hypothetical protein